MTRPARRPGTRGRKIGRPLASDGEETRRVLLTAAGHQFARYGYGAATLSGIAQAANVTAGAIYYYFDSKADLYTAVSDQWMSPLIAAYEARLSPTISLSDRVILYLDMMVDYLIAEPDLAWFWMHVDVEAPHHEPVAQLQQRMWPSTIAARTGFASGHFVLPDATGLESEPGLQSSAPPSGAELLPGTLLLELFALGAARLAVQHPGGPDRLPAMLDSLKVLIRGGIDELEKAHAVAEVQLQADRVPGTGDEGTTDP